MRLQFYFESAFVTAIAFVLAVAILQVSFPLFLRKLQLDIDMSFLWNTTFVVIMVGLFAICLVLSGTYPALVLSRFKPADIIRGKVGSRGRSTFFRKAFIVVQFTVTITLVICAFTVKDQLAYIRNKNLGLNKEQVMMIPISPDMSMAYAAFKMT
ncbi:MAG: hypothetical protein HC859_03840 [Bacteroidia bacterium]|nr:hypothetical protein [Bacteroidia bacterium]